MSTDEITKHVVSVSSGLGSAYLWSLVLKEHPDAVGVFADVNGEDEDNYRFLREVHEALGGELVTLDNNGETIWDVFRRTRFLGNTRVDTCSRELKRLPIQRWLAANCDPETTLMHIAIDWTEAHRIPANIEGWSSIGWQTAYWMNERYLDKNHALAWLETLGIRPPSLTEEGWPHANCKGGCVRAGHGQFAALYIRRPSAFAEWERNEAEFIEFIGKDVAILRDRRKSVQEPGKKVKPMPLSVLRERVDAGEIKPDLGDGACNCMSPIPGEG